MKVFLIVGALLALALAKPAGKDAEWESYKAKYGKTYSSKEVEGIRKAIYFQTKDRITAHNARYDQGLESYFMGINKFSDMLASEVAQKLNGYRQNPKRVIHTWHEITNLTLPKTVDWRKKGAVTPIKNQGQCGSCWAFSTTGSLEGQHKLKTGKLVSLSEQNLVDCSSAEGNYGCDGGLMDQGFEYIKVNHGIDTEKSYPYTAEQGTCEFKRSDVGATDTGYVNIKHDNEKALQDAVAHVGPISVAIDASLDSFTNYAGGVYDAPSCSSTELDHGVLAIGYGVYHGKDYWLVKNSWGTDWGIEGYIMMSRNKHNQCGIATEASYPVVKKQKH